MCVCMCVYVYMCGLVGVYVLVHIYVRLTSGTFLTYSPLYILTKVAHLT